MKPLMKNKEHYVDIKLKSGNLIRRTKLVTEVIRGEANKWNKYQKVSGRNLVESK